MLSFTLFSQSALYKEWYSRDNYLKITPKKSQINSLYNFDKTIIKKQNDSTLLTFIDYYWKAGSSKRFKEECQFEIIKLNDDTLILSAVNEKSKRYLRNQSPVIFIPHIWLGNADTNFHFQSLVFQHTPLPSLTTKIYELDSVGNMIYSIENFYDKKSYSKTLNPKELNKLIDLLSCYNFSRYNNYGRMVIDGNYFFLKVKYNDTISEVEIRQPSEADGINVLLDFLLSLSKDFAKKRK